MIENHLPMFTKQASCFDKEYDPEWWHPQELAGNGRKWSHTPNATLARSICHACPAKQECKDYSLRYSNLTGIWAGLDRIERHSMQVALDITPIDWLSTYESAVYRVPHNMGEK